MNESRTVNSTLGIVLIIILALGIGGWVYWQSQKVVYLEDNVVTPSPLGHSPAPPSENTAVPVN